MAGFQRRGVIRSTKDYIKELSTSSGPSDSKTGALSDDESIDASKSGPSLLPLTLNNSVKNTLNESLPETSRSISLNSVTNIVHVDGTTSLQSTGILPNPKIKVSANSPVHAVPSIKALPGIEAKPVFVTKELSEATSTKISLDAETKDVTDSEITVPDISTRVVLVVTGIRVSPGIGILRSSGMAPSVQTTSLAGEDEAVATSTMRDNPREIRNKAEKQRRDKLNQSIAELAAIVPPVVCSNRKVDKTSVLRYTAHYLRANQYVFDQPPDPVQFSRSSTRALLSLLNGFLLTTTYKGLIVVVSQNINDYLGYTELELLGKSVFALIHEDDRQLFRDQLIPNTQAMGQHGELVMPSDPEERQRLSDRLSNERRQFMVRFLKPGSRSEPRRYVTCHIDGFFRVSDRVMNGTNKCCQRIRRARARSENPYNSGNDLVFVAVVRPCTETFINEGALEYYRMEYRTRHSIDGEIIQCEQRISIITGYMMSEVSGVNAMNFIHRDEVRWVIIALKEMYSQSQLVGESCYRLMTKTGHFIYMRTRGTLEVDSSTRAASTFLCTNTVVTETEGKQLIKLMKQRYTFQAQCAAIEVSNEATDSQTVEDPRVLTKDILNLVTSLPAAEEETASNSSPDRGESPTPKLSIIAPKKERIVNAIEKIYSVLKLLPSHYTQDRDVRLNVAQYLSNSIDGVESNEELCELLSNSNLPSFEAVFNSQDDRQGFCSPETGSHEERNESQQDHILDMVIDLLSPESDPGSPGTSGVGVKRRNSIEVETEAKKVLVEDEAMASTSSVASDADSPNSVHYFDEQMLDIQIESTMALFEDTNDADFPVFLTSSEVENILKSAHGGTSDDEDMM